MMHKFVGLLLLAAGTASAQDFLVDHDHERIESPRAIARCDDATALSLERNAQVVQFVRTGDGPMEILIGDDHAVAATRTVHGLTRTWGFWDWGDALTFAVVVDTKASEATFALMRHGSTACVVRRVAPVKASP